MKKDVLRPAVFGSFDGVTSAIGVILALSSAPHSMLLAALGVGISGSVGMAAGEWQSESSHGFLASAVMGLATGTGTLLPVVPFLLCSGVSAVVLSVLITALAVAGIAKLRMTENKSYKRAALESYGILAVVVGTVWIGVRL